MTDPVAIRRKSDGRFFVGGRKQYDTKPRPIRSASAAEMIIRVDLGEDLEDFEIIPADRLNFNR